jgi:hypothetical protein
MSTYLGPNIVTAGKILDLDIGNPKSSKGRRSIITWDSWIAGTSGAATGYATNGDGNSRINDTNPFGITDVVWDVSNQDAASDEDGGWWGSAFTIDPNKMYRYTTWVRRKTIGNGNFYMGPHAWDGDAQQVRNRSNGASNQNPYFSAEGWGWATANQWYLVVGHIWPANSGTGATHPDSGVYHTNGTKVLNCTDYLWKSTNTYSYHRSFLYYSSDTTTNQQWYQPRVDIVDGTEPKISELLTNAGNKLYDLSGIGNDHTIYGQPTLTTDKTSFNITESHSFNRSSSLTGNSNNCTVVLWYKTSDTQELWVRGNNSGSVYLSASYGNNYYHEGCGSPVNYVDLNTVVNPATPVNYRNNVYHMWEAKGVDFSNWTVFDWFGYGTSWNMNGTLSRILVYNRQLTADESAQNYYALRGRYGI